MDNSLSLIVFVLTIMFLFALFFEINEQNNAYIKGRASSRDDIKRSLKKLDICLSYDLKTIKWRRSFICTILIIILLFIFVKDNEMTAKNLVLHFTVIFTIIYLNWRNYSQVIGSDVHKIGRKNIENISISLYEDGENMA